MNSSCLVRFGCLCGCATRFFIVVRSLAGLRDTSFLVGLSEHEFVLWFGSEFGGFA